MQQRRRKRLREALRRWKRGNGQNEAYDQRRKEYKKECEKKKKELHEREERELQQIKKEDQVWKYINKERKKRERMTKKIEIREWKSYFKGLLDGKEEQPRIEIQNEKEENEESAGEITEEEIRKQIKRLKNKKAAGEDGLENEVWKNGNKKIIRR